MDGLGISTQGEEMATEGRELLAGVFRVPKRQLARMFNDAWEFQDNWFASELGEILQHQLRAPLEFGFDSQADPGASRVPCSSDSGTAAIGVRTFRDLLSDPTPPVDLLQLTRQFAQTHLDHPGEALPPEIARLLFHGSVLVAWAAGLDSGGETSEAELLVGVDWVLEQPWVDGETRDLFRTNRHRLLDRANRIFSSCNATKAS
jgi:hypothetical protein